MPNQEPIASLFLSPEPLTRARYGEDASDAFLLDRFVEQWDQVAFRDLVGRHGPMVLGVCRRILGDPHAAEDAFQATFLLLVRKAGSVRKRGSVGPWLYAVARRVALDSSSTPQNHIPSGGKGLTHQLGGVALCAASPPGWIGGACWTVGGRATPTAWNTRPQLP